jgi:cysteine desulfurase family protein
MTLYLDNAATSHPKPQRVYDAVLYALTEVGATPGRAAHRRAREASSIVSRTRDKVARLLGVSDPERILFTKNATESINVVLKGWLRPQDRVLISAMEHNSVVRPLSRLKESGLQIETIPCSPGGLIDLNSLGNSLATRARLVVLAHASNVNGVLQPVAEIAKICAEAGVPLLLDAAQTAGVQPLYAEEWNLGMVACAGHKGLLGPPGVGILYIRKGLNVLPLVEGGTGSRSEEALQPEHCPDRFESGTLNLPGIAGLDAGLEYIMLEGVDRILRHEVELAVMIEEGLSAIEHVRVFRPDVRGTGTVSFLIDGMNPQTVGHLLDEGFDIAVRTGLHCAPLAHQTIGTYPEGTVRVSPGYSTTVDDVELFLQAIRSLVSLRNLGNG